MRGSIRVSPAAIPEDERDHRAAKLLIKDEARRMAAKIPKPPLLRRDLALLFCVLSVRQWHSAFLAFVDAKCRK